MITRECACRHQVAAQLLLSPKILLSFNPYAPFKEGDEALAEVLRNLEETQGIMDQVLQNQLHENYDMYVSPFIIPSLRMN